MRRSPLPGRLAAVAAVAAVTLLAAGCSGDEEPSPADTAATATSPSAGSATPSDAVVSWAGNVCSGVDTLRGAVREVAGAAPPELDASGTVPEQARADIKARADAVRQAGQTLVSTLRSPPPEAAAALSAATDQLSPAAAQAQTQFDATATAAASVASATTEADTKAALEDLRSALLSAGTAVESFASAFGAAIGNSEPEVRSAFSAAPSCQAIPFTASPSS
jgi:hypothetical protein